MEKTSYDNNYPAWIVIVSNLLSLSIYLIGSYFIFQAGMVWLLIYVSFILFMEIKLLKKSCVDCYYFGRTCAFAKGRLSCLFFRKGDSIRFSQRKATWKDMLPEFVSNLIPVVLSIYLLIARFTWPMLGLAFLYIILISFGNGFVRGNLACKFCMQRELGCPAEQLFQKAKE